MKQLEIIKNWNGYQVTSTGRVISPNGKELKPTILPKGYLTVGWANANERRHSMPVHRLVALCFLPNPMPEFLRQVGHRDGNPQNNNVANLYWTSNRENNRAKYADRLSRGEPLHTAAELDGYRRMAETRRRRSAA